MKAEEIFNENAKKVMIQWNLEDFKKTHPHLFRVILESINQAIAINRTI